MINLYNLVPTIYTNASRDFQYLTWLFNIVLNNIKHNVDDMYKLPSKHADPKLLELFALTLGFKIKRNYDQKQLAALVAVLPLILKCKGTEKAITIAAGALVTASGSTGIVDCTAHNGALEVTIPEDLADITLFIDLLPYILPAGMTCRLTRKTIEDERRVTEVYYHSEYHGGWQLDLGWDKTNSSSTGLAGLFTPDQLPPNFGNYYNNYHNSETWDEKWTDKLNVGLLANTVIPTLDYDTKIVPEAPQNDEESET